MSTEQEPRVYTIPEIAIMLKVSKNAAYVAAKDGTLPFRVLKVGTRRFVCSRVEVDRVLAGEAIG